MDDSFEKIKGLQFRKGDAFLHAGSEIMVASYGMDGELLIVQYENNEGRVELRVEQVSPARFRTFLAIDEHDLGKGFWARYAGNYPAIAASIAAETHLQLHMRKQTGFYKPLQRPF